MSDKVPVSKPLRSCYDFEFIIIPSYGSTVLFYKVDTDMVRRVPDHSAFSFDPDTEVWEVSLVVAKPKYQLEQECPCKIKCTHK